MSSVEIRMVDPQRALTRSTNQMIGGVCAGLAEWLGWDPTLVRVLYAVGTAVSGVVPGLVLYVILWAVMPAPSG